MLLKMSSDMTSDEHRVNMTMKNLERNISRNKEVTVCHQKDKTKEGRNCSFTTDVQSCLPREVIKALLVTYHHQKNVLN